MATTSIWRVNGWLGKVLIYIENPDKTENAVKAQADFVADGIRPSTPPKITK